MDGFDIFMAFMTYSVIASVFAASLDEKDNTLGRALIWPLILLLTIVKAIWSVCLETKAELKNWSKNTKKE